MDNTQRLVIRDEKLVNTILNNVTERRRKRGKEKENGPKMNQETEGGKGREKYTKQSQASNPHGGVTTRILDFI